jgi:Helicase HerA, central domain/TraM recognition site of TraD and TraG
MAGKDVPALYEELPPPSPAEILTALFYAWERRGRGWAVYNGPVVLEPPFRPFMPWIPGPASTPPDDARKVTFFSSLADRLMGRGKPDVAGPYPVAFEEPYPEYDWDTSPLAEIPVALPPTVRVTRETAARLLLSLGPGQTFAFEIVGRSDSIAVQLACRVQDASHVRQQLRAHFPDASAGEETGLLAEAWQAGGAGALVIDFGLSHEFMRPLRTFSSFEPDPLIAVTGALAELGPGETGILQVLFQPAAAPWAESIMESVTDGAGGPFFAGAPELVPLAREKVSAPLFAAVVRIAAMSPVPGREWEIARALGGALRQFGRPLVNELIPLSNADYEDAEHVEDLLHRRSHRSGMILNADELVSLVHFPSASVRVEKLAREVRKTRAAPVAAVGHALVLGENRHAGKTTRASLSPDLRLRHMHVIGASGTGKSHLLLSLIAQDLEAGEGLAVLDPHGDLVDAVLGFVPERRVEDVVLFDPGDAEWPVGFNVLRAHSDLERNLLASDLVALFRRLSTSWGDQMTSVLGNAVLAFLESSEGGTIAELRRFLVEPDFRRAFLDTVADPEIVYYWRKEFPLLSGKPQAPILTRLDAFLRHRLVRHMVAQKESQLDLAAVMNEGKILLAKLAQGAIGEENAYLLGTLLVSKFHQLALSRQELARGERRPFYLYIDEFQNFVTPSMAAILSGARKYGLGLVLAHQGLEQLSHRDTELTGAVLTNPATRIVFRVGGPDARRLAEGFTHFGPEDLQSLGVGEAVCRIERADWDLNLATLPLPERDMRQTEERTERILAHSRGRYATPRTEVEAALRERGRAAEPSEVALPKTAPMPGEKPAPAPRAKPRPQPQPSAPAEAELPTPPAPRPMGRGGAQHVYLQELIKRWAESRDWRTTIELPVLDGLGSVDVALEKGDLRVACEISVSSTPEQELGNVQKCLAAEFSAVVSVAADRSALRKLQQYITKRLDEAQREAVQFLTPEELFAFLEELEAGAAGAEETVRGYKVKVRYTPPPAGERQEKRKAISGVIARAVRRLRTKGT